MFGLDKLQNHTSEGKKKGEKERARRKKGGKEEKKKKTVVALLVFITAALAKKKNVKNCRSEKVHLAVTFSKIRIDI